MHPFRPFARAALALSLALGAAFAVAAGSAKNELIALDKTTASGYLEVNVSRYGPPDKAGKLAAPERYFATLLFQRPDRFRLALRPGESKEFRAVGEAGTVRWLDLATGASGKESAAKVTDPLALALLGTVGELPRFGQMQDLPAAGKQSAHYGARLDPNTYGSGVRRATAWFSNGTLTGLEFTFADGSRLFASITKLQRNVKTSPGDFAL